MKTLAVPGMIVCPRRGERAFVGRILRSLLDGVLGGSIPNERRSCGRRSALALEHGRSGVLRRKLRPGSGAVRGYPGPLLRAELRQSDGGGTRQPSTRAGSAAREDEGPGISPRIRTEAQQQRDHSGSEYFWAIIWSVYATPLEKMPTYSMLSTRRRAERQRQGPRRSACI